MRKFEQVQSSIEIVLKLHGARDCLRRALDQAEDEHLTTSGVGYIISQCSRADDLVHTVLRLTNELASALDAEARERERLLIV